MIYTHVSKKDLLRIESPLDIAIKKITKAENIENDNRLSQHHL